MRALCRFLLIAVSLVEGCGGGGRHNTTVDSSAGPTSSLAVPSTPSQSATKDACPADGQWTDCAVFDRLDHAGLAPRRDSTATNVELAPLTQRGRRLLIGNSELDVFLFPDQVTRQREESHLDRSKFIEATDEPTLRGEATLIRNANLLAVLRSRNDHQRERVSDALSAGPPQPRGATTLPPTRAPR